MSKEPSIHIAGALAGLGIGMVVAGAVWSVLLPPKHRAAAMGRAWVPADCKDASSCDVLVKFRLKEKPFNLVKANVSPPSGVTYRSDITTAVVVWYDPTNPTDARLTPPPLITWNGIALAGAGLLLIVLTCVVYARRIKKRGPAAPSVSLKDQIVESNSAASTQTPPT